MEKKYEILTGNILREVKFKVSRVLYHSSLLTAYPHHVVIVPHTRSRWVLWSLEFGVLHEFLLINLFDTARRMQDACRMHAGRITGAIAGHTARTNFDLSTGQLNEKFRWDLLIVGAELVAWSARLDVL